MGKNRFALQDIETTKFFDHPINTSDLGAIGRGLFTKKKRIRISELEPRQTHVNGGTINLKLTGKHFTVPCVVIAPNCKILIDGHHTVIAKKLRGQKFVLAQCYLLPSIE